MTIEVLINDIGKIIIFLMVLMSMFLITAKSSNRRSNYLFAAFLLVSAFDLSGMFLSIQNPTLSSLKIASVLLQMPLYYLYVQSVCYYNFKLQAKHLLHSLLFVGVLMLFIVMSNSDQSYSIYLILSKIQYYSYIIAVLFTLRHFRKLYQENYSSNHYHTYKWLLQVTVLFLIGSSFVLLRDLLPPGQNSLVLTSLNLLTSIFALFVISWFVLNALNKPSLFLGVDKNLISLKPTKKANVVSEKNIRQLSEFMITEKPYLDPELSLQKLASGINLPEKELSQLINQQIGKHFFDYINEFRINDAKILLKEKPDLTVLEILYEVGFNSKSSFYTAFKKETSQTPTAYRKS